MISWTQIKGIPRSERDFIEKFIFFWKDSMIFAIFMPLKIELFFFKCGFEERKKKIFNILRMFFNGAKNYCKNSLIWDQSQVSSSIRLEMRAS